MNTRWRSLIYHFIVLYNLNSTIFCYRGKIEKILFTSSEKKYWLNKYLYCRNKVQVKLTTHGPSCSRAAWMQILMQPTISLQPASVYNKVILISTNNQGSQFPTQMSNLYHYIWGVRSWSENHWRIEELGIIKGFHNLKSWISKFFFIFFLLYTTIKSIIEHG